MNYCLYYQAHVVPAHCWFLTATLRSHEHISFDRTVDVENSIFEFFVPEATEKYFLDVMQYYQEHGMVKNLQKLPNRLAA